jgi:hypothetical protein
MSDSAAPAASPAILARHRANAKKSTGPRTAAAKARSRRNAVTHGLTAEQSLHGAAMRDVARRAAALVRTFTPENDFDDALVARMATAFQRLERVERLERDTLDSTMTFRPQSDGAKLANNNRCR